MKKREKFWLAVGAAVILIFAFSAGVNSINYATIAANGVETVGRVVDVQRTRQVRTTYVQYTANGMERTNRLRFPNVIRNFRIGQDLTVFYSPQNPDFIARNPIVDFLISVITFIGIGIFIAVGVRSVWKTPRE